MEKAMAAQSAEMMVANRSQGRKVGPWVTTIVTQTASMLARTDGRTGVSVVVLGLYGFNTLNP